MLVSGHKESQDAGIGWGTVRMTLLKIKSNNLLPEVWFLYLQFEDLLPGFPREEICPLGNEQCSQGTGNEIPIWAFWVLVSLNQWEKALIVLTGVLDLDYRGKCDCCSTMETALWHASIVLPCSVVKS